MKVGFVPEHFSTPLFFAQEHGFYTKHGVDVEFVPFPSGTGHMIQSLKEKSIDVAIGLTEAFISGIGKGADHYKLVGTYVQSPLCWAISTGAKREDIQSDNDIENKTIGISRLGSGSNVMPFVLAQQRNWDGSKFTFEIQDTFKNLRAGVNHTGEVKPTDAFMWEVFTTKRYYDNGELKQIGHIYTPWPSWVITASTDILQDRAKIDNFFKAVNEGIEYFNSHNDEAVEYIAGHFDYTADDAREWLKTVTFVKDVSKIDEEVIVNKTISTLKTAGVLSDGAEKLTYVQLE